MHDVLNNLIDRCIDRHKQPKHAQKTRYSSDGYSTYYAIHDGKLQSANPRDFEAAQLGIMPIGRDGKAIEYYAASVGKDWKTRYGFDDWEVGSWKQSYGVQVYTGTPSDCLTDLDFEIDIVRDYPELLIATLSDLCDLTTSPLITISKSGGIRFSTRTPDYVHPRTTDDREYIAAYNQETGKRDALYLEIFGEKGLSRWDARYEIITGDLFKIPTIDTNALFEIIDNLKDKIHVPPPTKKEKKNHTQQSQSKDKKKRQRPDVQMIDGLPTDITWIPTGEPNKYKSRRSDYPCNFTKHTKSHGQVQYYQNTQTDETTEFCHNCREWQWIHQPKYRTRKIKLHKSGTQLTLETLQRSRTFLEKVFDSTAKVFGLRADTGVGKNEAAIQHVYKGIKLLLNLPHKNLMHELAARFDKAEITPFAYRGILSNPDGAFPYENPCIQPAKYDAYARKGGNPRDVICPPCPVRWMCESAGHWHDLRQLKKYQVNLFTFPQLFTNPIFRGWIGSNIGTLEKEDLILHDDTEITSLFCVTSVSRDYLENVSRQHHGTNTGSFVDIVLSLLHKDNLYENLKNFIFEQITAHQRDEIIDGLSHVRIDGQLLSLDDAVERGHFKVDTHQDINALPTVADREWTLLHQLELFFDMYPHAPNAPIIYSDGVLSFALAPILPKTKARIGFMGATLQQEHLKRAFPEPYYPNVLFFDATSTEWHPDARVYQLATNRNPRRTVLTDGKLNATGQAYWDSVIDIVSRLDGQHAIITYKSVLAEKETDIEKHDLITAHFGGLTGLDELFKDIDYLHILFSPERPPFALEWDAKMIYGADADILSFDRDDAGEFTDKRVQSVYDAGAIAELIQAIGRGRLVNFGKKVFVWCSHSLPTITDRDQTHLFTERDIAQWHETNTETLENIIVGQADRTPAEIAAEEGITERQAYNRTETTRKQDKAEKKATAKQMHDAGESITEIAKKLGINKSTVSRWLNP